ncbi:MAG: ATP-dependent helicase [Nitrospiraceae bacterium]
MKTHKIFGPPGTGKTTRLLSLLSSELENVSGEEIGYFTHTKAATRDAKERMHKSGTKYKDMKWVRTSHSAACGLAGIGGPDIWGKKVDWETLRDAGYMCKGSFDADDLGADDTATWDATHFAYGVIRARRQTLPEGVLQFNQANGKLNLRSIEDFAVTYERVKQELGRKDYNDMLTEYIENDYGASPIKVLFLDEAQDFSKLQWDFITKLCAAGVERLYLAGDDDQAIFSFTGSDEYGFLDFPADVNEVLTKSWRCPIMVGEVAEKLTRKLLKRKEKAVEWQKKPGGVLWSGMRWEELNWLEHSKAEQQVMVLCRHRRRLWKVKQHLSRMGIPCSMDGKSSASKVVEIAIIYHDLRSERDVGKKEAARLLWWKGERKAADRMRKSKDDRINMKSKDMNLLKFEGDWIKYLAKTKDQVTELNDLRTVLRISGIDSVRKPPMIDVSTYHSSKGREADVVICLTDVSRAVNEEQIRNPDTEIRLAYVGLTRTKNRCIVLAPKRQQQMIGLRP